MMLIDMELLLVNKKQFKIEFEINYVCMNVYWY